MMILDPSVFGAQETRPGHGVVTEVDTLRNTVLVDTGAGLVRATPATGTMPRQHDRVTLIQTKMGVQCLATGVQDAAPKKYIID